MPRTNLLCLLALVATTVACSHDAPATENTRIHGTVGQELRQPGMEALAIGSDGRWISTSVAADGGFTLDLPAGQSYRVVLATKTASGAERIVARVVLDGSSGRTVWVSTTAKDVAFGTLHQVGTATASSNPSGLATQSETVETGETGEAGDTGEKEGSDDGADKSTEHDKDSYEACGAKDAKDVEPSNSDADSHADSAEHDDDHEAACDDNGEKEDD